MLSVNAKILLIKNLCIFFSSSFSSFSFCTHPIIKYPAASNGVLTPRLGQCLLFWKQQVNLSAFAKHPGVPSEHFICLPGSLLAGINILLIFFGISHQKNNSEIYFSLNITYFLIFCYYSIAHSGLQYNYFLPWILVFLNVPVHWSANIEVPALRYSARITYNHFLMSEVYFTTMEKKRNQHCFSHRKYV